MATNLKERYQKTIAPELAKELGVSNAHQTPRVTKVVVNVGLGRASQQASFKDKILPGVLDDLALICGQRPAPRQAKKSIAGFKLRQGTPVGVVVTLRGSRMYDFIEKIIATVFPRLRDFKGITLKNVDLSGNLNIGFKEHSVFPDVSPDTTKADFGLQVTLVTNASSRDDAIALYRKIGFLFKEDKKKGKTKE